MSRRLAVANTLTVFAIRDVGLSVAFPLWNMNGLIGLLWGWLAWGALVSGETAGLSSGVRLLIIGGSAVMALGPSTTHGAALRNASVCATVSIAIR